VKLITLDPGHFHAALVQKTMYDQVSPTVFVYAPAGPDLDEHLKRVESYNTRPDSPTRWQEKIYTGADFLKKMLQDIPGNVMVTAGNNQKKTEYLKATIDAGINVLSDKPMCIDLPGFALLQQTFASAQKQGLLLYDIMTERYEITSILQKELAHVPAVFGQMQKGTPDDPAVTKESVHHYYKLVSGKPLIRPGWAYDVRQQGEGVVDVTTHLVDLVMWACYPEQVIDYQKQVEVLRARRWNTQVTKEQFTRSTNLADFPAYLQPNIGKDGKLSVSANGEIVFKVREVCARVSVTWNYEAPPGGGDTHYSVMKGSRVHLIIKQGKEQKYVPELYVQGAAGANSSTLEADLRKAVANLQGRYPGIGVEPEGALWHIIIPASYRNGHEAHFGQVTERFLQYLKDGKMPDWEVPNMIAKYYITTRALEMAKSPK
jgi:predicted dehydrogenase